MAATIPLPSGSALPAKSTAAANDDPPSGLTSDEARRRLDEFGPNAMPDTALHPLHMALEKFWAPVPWMLEAAIVLELVLGKYVEAGIIAGLLVFNAALGLFQESRAQATLAALKSRLALDASVRRDGAWKTVPAAELVPGDVVKLSLGAVVAADVHLSGGEVLLDQSMLTGKSVPIEAGAVVESLADPRDSSDGYAYLFEKVLGAINDRFPSNEKTRPEKLELAKVAARIISAIAEKMNTDRRRRTWNVNERHLLLDISGSPPRCWICGVAFGEKAIDNFLFKQRQKLDLPPFVDVYKPRGLMERDLAIEVDHLLPLSSGGLDEGNLKLACGWCNRYKSAHLSVYDVEGQPRPAGPNSLGITSLPQPFWVVRLLGLARSCEYVGGCNRRVDDAELTVVAIR